MALPAQPNTPALLDLNVVLAAAKITVTLRNQVSYNPQYGILGSHRNSNLRTFRVLDALASLSVSRPRVQVVAITFRLDYPQYIHLYISENTDVDPKTIQYLKTLWQKLQGLSNLYAAERKAQHVQVNHDVPSPKVPVSPESKQAIHQLASHVYGFTELKHAKRTRKWWDPLCQFTDCFLDDKGRNLLGLEGEFENMMVTLREAIDAQRDHVWPLVVPLMDQAVTHAEVLLDDKVHLECWSREARQEAYSRLDTEDFPLRHAIEKITSHHRHFRNLIGFAYSPRLRRALCLNLILEPVPCTTPVGEILLPSSAAEWQVFLSAIAGAIPDLREGWIEEQSDKLYLSYKKTDHQPRVHCECALIAHLEHSNVSSPAFSYIAVSKLCCRPCYLWLRAFNERGGRQYYTRGTHGKWYFPWTAPPIDGWDQPAQALNEQIVTLFRYHVQEEYRRRSGSDSTDASGQTVFEVDEEAQDLVRKAIKKNRERRFRVSVSGVVGV